jgi:DNA replication protein DnaC
MEGINMSLDYQTIEKLKSMRLKPMAEAFERQLNNPAMQELSFGQRFGLIVDYEDEIREQNKKERLRRRAKLKQQACPENVKYGAERGLIREVVEPLFSCDCVRRSQNIIITGATGTGKTWLASAFGHAAIEQKYSVRHIRLARLFEDFQISQGDGSIRKYRSDLAKAHMLIIDDWALTPVTTQGRHELLELIDERMGFGTIILTSQLPVEKWHDYLGEPTVADAILDRIVQRAHRIELKGESMRKADLPDINSKEVA